MDQMSGMNKAKMYPGGLGSLTDEFNYVKEIILDSRVLKRDSCKYIVLSQQG